MHIITKSRLREFWTKHPDAKGPLQSWFRNGKAARWANLAAVRRTYAHADSVNEFTVFNIGGNKYRLVAEIVYKVGIVYIRSVMTHEEYDRGRWKS